mgnify:CR=1 FL=1|jgi:hypothetical protein
MIKICIALKEIGNKLKIKIIKEVEIHINKWEENRIKEKLHKNKLNQLIKNMMFLILRK